MLFKFLKNENRIQNEHKYGSKHERAIRYPTQKPMQKFDWENLLGGA